MLLIKVTLRNKSNKKAEITDGNDKKYKRAVRIFQYFLKYKKMGKM